MSTRALVTGAGGFVGQWVVRALAEGGWTVVGAGLGEAPWASGGAPDGFRWVPADFTRAADVCAVVDDAAPDLVIHLAGIAFVPAAAADPGLAYEVNVAATGRLLGILQARRDAGVLDPVTVVVGSGEQYGRHEASEMPLGEDAEQRPLTVYAASKAAQEVVALAAARTQRVVCTRSFNHSGPGQHPNFLLPALVGRALALPRGGGGTLSLGNLAPVRDYLHVADVARAYIALAGAATSGAVFNVSSGRGASVREVAERILARLGVDAEIVSDPALVREADVPVLVGDSARLRAATGWAPHHTLDDIIDDLIHAATR